MANFITIKDVLASISKYGKENILTWNPSEYRDNKQKNKEARYDCTWIPLKFKMENGKETDLKNLKYMKVLTASAAKLPSASTEESIKNLLVAFRKFTIDEILTGDYAPKKKDSDEEQAAEDERALKIAEELKKNTDEFNEVMEAIDLSFQRIADELKSAKSLGFLLNKNTSIVKSIKESAKKTKKKASEIEAEINAAVTVYSIRQTSYEDTDTKEDVEMQFPITRLKLMLKDGMVETELRNVDQGRYICSPNVFNAQKLDARGYPVPAKVKVNGESRYLDTYTAGQFITYKSRIGGLLEFSDLVVSKFGVSLRNRFKALYVKRHNVQKKEPVFSREEFKDFQGSDDDGDDGDVVIEDSADRREEDATSDLEDKADDEPGDDPSVSPSDAGVGPSVGSGDADAGADDEVEVISDDD
jgi:hypothetical protein